MSKSPLQGYQRGTSKKGWHIDYGRRLNTHWAHHYTGRKNPFSHARMFPPSRLQQAISGTLLPLKKHVRLLAGGLVTATLFGFSPVTMSQVLELSDLYASNGFKIYGEDAGDQFGHSVSIAGDINADGIDDLIVGALGADPGASYVVFGSNNGFLASIELSDLDGSNGFRINGESQNQSLGRHVSDAGDINGDGIDDLVIAAGGGLDFDGGYVIFGKQQNFITPMALSSLDGTNGFKLYRPVMAGSTVADAGDINGDGIDDVLIGESFASSNGRFSGRVNVVFGSDQGFTTPVDLSKIFGKQGFKLFGESEGDRAGYSLSSAGDINGDDINDIIIGAPFGEYFGVDRGASYVVFGGDQGFNSPFELSSLDGNNGFIIRGERRYHKFGFRVAGIGDINNDDIDDLMVGSGVGDHHVVFGSRSGFANPFDLTQLDGSNGFSVIGGGVGGISAAGDVNDDGIDDLVFGYANARPNGSGSGAAYVVFGSDQNFSAQLDVEGLDGTNGFKINGESEYDSAGVSVSGGGDINGDGIDDIVIGASQRRAEDKRGAIYVIFGSPTIGQVSTPHFLTCLGDVNGDGSQDISALISDLTAGTLTAIIKDAGNGDLISQVEFDGSLTPVDMEVMADINNNGSPELVVLGNEYTKAEIRDSLTGDLLGSAEFDASIAAHDLELVPDQDGNGIPELAHLGKGSLNVELIDPLTSNTVESVPFFNSFLTPMDLSVLIGSTNMLAVLAEHNKSDMPDKIQLRNLPDGSFVRNIFLGKSWQVKQLELLSDFNGNGSQEAAVLRTHSANDQTNVLVKDTESGDQLSYLSFGVNYQPLEMNVTPDVNGNGSDEIVVLLRNNDGSQQKAWVKDSSTRQLIKQINFNPNFIGQDITICPDMNGNSASELAVLGKLKHDGKIRVIIKDITDGSVISKIDF